jgi:ABC-type sugar transport system substrate-binding protein
VSDANVALQPYINLPTTLPSGFTSLPHKPGKGSLIILTDTVPAALLDAAESVIAAQAAGWTAKKINFDGSAEDLNAKFEQAISEKPTAIMMSGFPADEMQKPLADAKAAGIYVSLYSLADQPTSAPGFAAQSDGLPVYAKSGSLGADLLMRASNCKGSVAIVSIAGIPALASSVNGFIKTLKSSCLACNYSVVALQIKDLGTPAATTAIVSALQSSPSTKYVFAANGDLLTGLTTALSQAGITGITQFGQIPNTEQVAGLRAGQDTWWIQPGSLITSWIAFDALLHALETKRPYVQQAFPMGIFTPQNVGTGTAVPIVPANYQELFKTLWHVS